MKPESQVMTHNDAFAKVVGHAGRFFAKHPQPLLARACVQFLIRAPQREIEVRDRSGHLQRIDTRDQMGANLLLGRYRLPDPVIARIKRGEWVVDVGANVGVITSQLAATVGRAGRVWAIEPIPENCDRLRFLKENNDLSQLTVFPLAAGAEDGFVTIGLPPAGRSGWGSITKSWNVGEHADVRVARIDSLVRGSRQLDQPSVSFLKIDVEGFEFEVVRGAEMVLRTHKPAVYCEFNDVLLRDRHRSSVELLALFAEHGYQPAEEDAATAAQLENRVVNLLLLPYLAPQ